jgi:large subunit ribosomal protein L17
LSNLACALVTSKKIRTTLLNAKEAGRYTEKLITIAKKRTLAARRRIVAELHSKDVAKALVDVIAPVFKDRKGGYTRVLKADNRPGDGAQMAYLEFTEIFEAPVKKSEKKKEKKEKPVKEKTKAEKPEKESKPEAEAGEEKKSSGFLGTLRGFLKGE